MHLKNVCFRIEDPLNWMLNEAVDNCSEDTIWRLNDLNAVLYREWDQSLLRMILWAD